MTPLPAAICGPERYDRELADIFAIQEEISLRLANEMQVHLTDGEHARLRYVTVSNFEAWSYWVRGQAAAWSYGSKPSRAPAAGRRLPPPRAATAPVRRPPRTH